MKRRMVVIALIFSFVLVSVSAAYCNDAFRKLGRGFCNIITSPFEIIEQSKRINESDGPMASLTYGIVKGVVMTCVRCVVGVYEVVTFTIPIPEDYEPILDDPEFFFEDKNW